MDHGLVTTLGMRSAQRVCLRTDVGVIDDKKNDRQLGQLFDLSSSGACLKTQKAVPLGHELRLAFEYQPGEPPVRLRGQVVWSARDPRARSAEFFCGIHFIEIAPPDQERLRKFIDQRLWTVQQFLCTFELFADLNDLEKLLLASISLDRQLKAGESLEEMSGRDCLYLVRQGEFLAQEYDREGRPLPPRPIGVGDFCGGLPVDASGGLRVKLTAIGEAAAISIPCDGFWYLWRTSPETALKLLSCWTLSLRDRLLVAPQLAGVVPVAGTAAPEVAAPLHARAPANGPPPEAVPHA